MELTIFLSVISLLLGIIATILSVAFRVGYDMLTRILTAVEDHGRRVVGLETYTARHDKEVSLYRDGWRAEGDRVWEELHEVQEELRVLQRGPRPNGPERP